MNKSEIRRILDAHKEHFRVLPTRAMNALRSILDALNAEIARGVDFKAETIEVKSIPEVKEKPVDLGNRTSKTTKKSKRPKR